MGTSTKSIFWDRRTSCACVSFQCVCVSMFVWKRVLMCMHVRTCLFVSECVSVCYHQMQTINLCYQRNTARRCRWARAIRTRPSRTRIYVCSILDPKPTSRVTTWLGPSMCNMAWTIRRCCCRVWLWVVVGRYPRLRACAWATDLGLSSGFSIRQSSSLSVFTRTLIVDKIRRAPIVIKIATFKWLRELSASVNSEWHFRFSFRAREQIWAHSGIIRWSGRIFRWAWRWSWAVWQRCTCCARAPST